MTVEDEAILAVGSPGFKRILVTGFVSALIEIYPLDNTVVEMIKMAHLAGLLTDEFLNIVHEIAKEIEGKGLKKGSAEWLMDLEALYEGLGQMDHLNAFRDKLNGM